MNGIPTTPESTADTSRWFSEEVHPHGRALKDYIRHAFPRLSDVEDIVQESYLRVWRQRAIEPIRSARAFLFSVAQRIAIDGMRRRRRSPIEYVASLQELNPPDLAPIGRTQLEEEEKIELLVAAINSLPARCRAVVILRKLKLQSQEETAAELGVSEKCVEVQLARGLERCRNYLQRRGAEHLFHDER